MLVFELAAAGENDDVDDDAVEDALVWLLLRDEDFVPFRIVMLYGMFVRVFARTNKKGIKIRQPIFSTALARSAV